MRTYESFCSYNKRDQSSNGCILCINVICDKYESSNTILHYQGREQSYRGGEVESRKILGWHDSVTSADDFTPPNNCHMTYIIPEKCRSCTLAWIIFSECNKQNLFFQLSCPFLVDETKPYFHYLQSSL